jgi:hypothetical protein
LQPFGALRLRELFRIDIDAERVRTQRPEFVDVRADAAANVEHPRAVKTNIAANQLQPPVLAKAPNVRGMPQLDGFVFDAHRTKCSRGLEK